jgi:hypothetical protein
MSLEIARRVKALEAKVAALEAAVQKMTLPPATPAEKPVVQKLCPHCNAVPAYYFHVKNCPANKKNKGDDRQRDPGTT